MTVVQSRTDSVHHDAQSGQINSPQMSRPDSPCCSPPALFGSLPKITELLVMIGNSNASAKRVISSHFKYVLSVKRKYNLIINLYHNDNLFLLFTNVSLWHYRTCTWLRNFQIWWPYAVCLCSAPLTQKLEPSTKQQGGDYVSLKKKKSNQRLCLSFNLCVDMCVWFVSVPPITMDKYG